MDLQQAIDTRRSVRAYSDSPIDRTLLRRLINAAVQAPNAVNEQAWSFTVVLDRELLRRISADAKAHLLHNPPAGAIAHHLQEILGAPQFDIFYGAPALIVISSTARTPWAVENCSLAAQNLMLAAHSEGLGSCWIGFAQAWLGTPVGRTALRLAAEELPVAPIIVGHPKSVPPAVPRKEPQIRWIGP